MDIDERIGEMLLLMEENYAPTKERITSTLAKVKQYVKNQELEERSQEVRKYLQVQCQDKIDKKVDPSRSKQVKGYV